MQVQTIYAEATRIIMSLIAPYSFQLYSARNFFPVNEVLRTIAEIGFTNVEPFPALYADAATFKRSIDAYGLSARSGHVALHDVEGGIEDTYRMAELLEMELIVLPYIDGEDRPVEAAGWRMLSDRLASAADKLAAKGLKFAWHNHDFEFQPLADGTIPLDLLLGDGLLWEADVAWVARAGQKPEDWLKRYTGRIPAVHVKDLAPPGRSEDEKGWADVGTGIVPWVQLWPLAVECGAQIMVAEHDHPSDYHRFARQAFVTMSKLNGAN
jgi:sugar phosphate isomerase/epimerase